MKTGEWRKFLMAIGAVAVVLTGTILSGCNGKAKQEAILAVDAAKLSVADAKKVRATTAVSSLVKEAESSLKQAEKSLEKKKYSKAKGEADSASMSAKMAIEEAKKKPAKKAASSSKSKKS